MAALLFTQNRWIWGCLARKRAANKHELRRESVLDFEGVDERQAEKILVELPCLLDVLAAVGGVVEALDVRGGPGHVGGCVKLVLRTTAPAGWGARSQHAAGR